MSGGYVILDGEACSDLYDAELVSIQFDADRIECPECGEEIADYGDRWEGHADNCAFRWPFRVENQSEASECDEGFDTREAAEAWIAEQDEEDRETFGYQVVEHPTEPDLTAPRYWCNGAGVEVKDDAIEVWISIGDPRGAFVMRAERVACYDEHGNATGEHELRLSVPHPSAEWLHMPLAPLASEGYYKVGR